MKLEKLHIKNFKSLVDLEIIKPNPFTVFAGPNGAGKSNIFEALEFAFLNNLLKGNLRGVFGSKDDIISKQSNSDTVEFFISDSTGSEPYKFSIHFDGSRKIEFLTTNTPEIFLRRYSRIFIGNRRELKIVYKDDVNLALDCSNLEKVLKRLLEDEAKREDITAYLEMMIPGLERVEIDSNNLSGTDTLLIYEKGIKKPFTKDLISDGTYNIICLLTALFQSDEPQFLCIEEPENGLNPYVVQEFVELCRLMCEDHGHYIWLNTHSQTLVRALKEEELILVDKEAGATKIKQFDKGSFHGLLADDAWLMNALGAGIPW